MERLRNALEHLEAPDCPNCHLTMRWFRSELVRDDQQSTVAHLFICPNCKGARRVDTDFTPPVRIPPEKLATPRFRVVRGGRR